MSKIFGIHTPVEPKNHAINGAFDFWQEKVGTTITVNTASTTVGYSADMALIASVGPTTKNYSYQRSTDVPSAAQTGFQSPYSLLFTMVTGITTPNTADAVQPFQYRMEGLDFIKIHRKTVTYGFWMKTSVAGTYSFSLSNAAETRSYVTNFTMNGANTWEYKNITVLMDQAGTWTFDNAQSLLVRIGTTAGATYQTATLDTWQAGAFYTSSTATNWQATTGATMRLTQFSIVDGSLGFPATGFQRAGKTIQQELALCQRYYSKSYDSDTAPNTAIFGGLAFGLATDTNTLVGSIPFKASMRTNPSVTIYNPNDTVNTNRIYQINNAANITISGIAQKNSNLISQISASGTLTAGVSYFYHYVADSRL